MHVVIYHEVRPEALDSVMQEGIKRDDYGEKSDSEVQRTDECLESRIPAELVGQGISRHNVVYGYLSSGDKLIDIRSGAAVDIHAYSSQRDLVLLRITAESADCFVSDLDAYDAVKAGVESGAAEDALSRLADRYWARVVPLDVYLGDHEARRYLRPEVMVANDVDANSIEVVTRYSGL
jgi:hypothetical protein